MEVYSAYPKGLLHSLGDVECQNFPRVQIHQGNIDRSCPKAWIEGAIWEAIPKGFLCHPADFHAVVMEQEFHVWTGICVMDLCYRGAPGADLWSRV